MVAPVISSNCNNVQSKVLPSSDTNSATNDEIPESKIPSMAKTEPTTNKATNEPSTTEKNVGIITIVNSESIKSHNDDCIAQASTHSDSRTDNCSEYDLDLLSRVIYSEAGCDWIPDWVQLYVGSVVLNRVKSSIYPNSIEGVLYDPGQYPYSLYDNTPNERAIENARQLLKNGSILPANVLGQNGDATGSAIYEQYHDDILGCTIYFTYVY